MPGLMIAAESGNETSMSGKGSGRVVVTPDYADDGLMRGAAQYVYLSGKQIGFVAGTPRGWCAALEDEDAVTPVRTGVTYDSQRTAVLHLVSVHLVGVVRAYAKRNAERGWHVVDSYDDQDLADLIGEVTTETQAIRKLAHLARAGRA